MKHRAMQMADDLGHVLGKPIRKAPETKAKPAPRWEKTSTKGYLRDPATGAVARDADVPFDRQPLTKAQEDALISAVVEATLSIGAAWIASGAAGEEVKHVDADGWIAHDGGECPIPDALAGEWNLKWSNMPRGEKQSTSAAAVMRWSHIGTDCDITAYRLLPAYHERKAREVIPVGEATEVPSFGEMRAAWHRTFVRMNGNADAARALIVQFGYKSPSLDSIPPERRAACIAALNALAQPEPTKAGLDWTPHKAGDPMPVGADVNVCTRVGNGYENAPGPADDFRWGACTPITHWRLAEAAA